MCVCMCMCVIWLDFIYLYMSLGEISAVLEICLAANMIQFGYRNQLLIIDSFRYVSVILLVIY